VLGLQRIGTGTAYAYVAPGAVIWIGLLMTGAHPTLAGVVLGLMTPVHSLRMRERPQAVVARVAQELSDHEGNDSDASELKQPLRQLRVAQREVVPPVVRVQAALHPWVAYGVMPLFALANAGVSLDGIDLSASGPQWVMMGVAVALILGKPIGILAASWAVIRMGWCSLP